MERETILYISDQTTPSNAVSAALNAADYEVVTTNTTEAVALLYILHSIVAVVLQARAQAAGVDVRSIRALCPDVPIILLCRGRIDCVPSRVDTVDTYVTTGQSPATVAAAIRRLVTKKPAAPCPRRPELRNSGR
jgi:hypothetical protein